jgi:hypothetical protein
MNYTAASVTCFIVGLVIIPGAVAVSRVRARRAKARTAALIRSISAHPAGKALAHTPRPYTFR